MIRSAALFLTAALATGQEAQPRPLVIRVTRDEWGKAPPEDVKRVLESAGESLSVYFHSRSIPPIEVSRTDMDPITLFERGPGGEIRMRLNVDGMYWAQFAFQFGHELGHVFSGNLEYSNPNLWFEETVCEAASLFVLGRLAETWKTNPPYPNWKGYSESLAAYRRERLESAKIPGGASLPEWFAPNESSLRKDPHQRAMNLAMAKVLLPLFESEPARWEAIGALNTLREGPNRAFRQYLRDWRSSADKSHRPFILAIAERFGVSLDP
jgi:hypothetical protein